MQNTISKLRNVYGEVNRNKIEDIRASESSSEGSLHDVNAKFAAVSWSASGGGLVSVFDSQNTLRVKPDNPVIRGHTAPVTEIKFSPFNDNLLATGSEDSTVRIWEIPQDGMNQDITIESQKLAGHSKKINNIAFNPCVAEVLASSSMDGLVNVWNISNGSQITKHKFNESVLSLNWNHNGSLLGLTSKAKMVHIFDPRLNKLQMETLSQDSSKSQKMLFLDENFLMTCGFGRGNDRQIKLFDMRNFTEAVQTVQIDSQSGAMMPYFDQDTGLIFIAGKGEGNIKYFDFTNSNILTASEFRNITPQKGITFLPKRALNYNKCELARAAKLTNNSIEFVSFYMPRRNEGYDSTLYPPCLACEASLSLDEWVAGENREPIRKDITTLSPNLAGNSLSFEKKVQEVVETKSKSNDENIRVAELEKLVKEFEEKINLLNITNSELSSQLEQEQTKNKQLQADIDTFKPTTNTTNTTNIEQPQDE